MSEGLKEFYIDELKDFYNAGEGAAKNGQSRVV
jgi:hypothetical protein